MTRFIVRTVLTTLALALLFAGSFNLNRISAQEEFAAEEGGDGAAPVSECQRLAGCPGGPTTCGTLILPDGTIVKCGKG